MSVITNGYTTVSEDIKSLCVDSDFNASHLQLQQISFC
jgi:hypothetical protein